MVMAGTPASSGEGMPSWCDRAAAVLPRGVASGARIRTSPIVFQGAEGAEIIDVDGNRYIDCVLGMGPILLGHGQPEILKAVQDQIGKGVLFGTHPGEIQLAERLVGLLPYADRILFANSGSEGTHLALRVARASTGRRLIVKFEGHYHGWVDPLFVNTQAVPPSATALEHPESVHAAGLTKPEDILLCRWNDADELQVLFDEHGHDIAAVIMEPLPMNFGTMWPDVGYLNAVRQMSDDSGSLLIFDEVLSGFRVALGGAAQLLEVQPDIGVYAKAIAAGFPLAIVAGSEAAMDSIINGKLVPAGTYSASPTGVSAANAMMDILETQEQEIYPYLDSLGQRVRDGVRRVATTMEVPLVAQQIGSVVQLLWDPVQPVRTYADASAGDREIVARLCEELLQHGFLVAPRGLILLSARHTSDQVDALVDAIEAVVGAWIRTMTPGRPS